MNFFKWLKWVFSKRLRHDVKDCKFEGVTDKSVFTKNGVFYEHNVRYSAINCEFIPWKEPEPNVMKLEINMGIGGYDSIFYNSYTGGLKLENNPDLEPIIVHPSGDFPFKIVSVPDKQLNEEERIERFCDALNNWNKIMERHDVENMNVDVDKICNKDKNG